jgi:hypothetical protein
MSVKYLNNWNDNELEIKETQIKWWNGWFKFLISTIFRFDCLLNIMNRTAKKSTRERKSIDKISTTNSTIRFKEIIDRNVVKLNSNVYMDKKNIFTTSKKTNEFPKKIKSALNTPKNSSTIKLKSPKKLMK